MLLIPADTPSSLGRKALHLDEEASGYWLGSLLGDQKQAKKK